jgi:hypothetical protein
VGLQNNKENGMSSDGYEEIKDAGPSPSEKRVDTANRAAKHAVTTMKTFNRYKYFGVYQMGSETLNRELNEIQFESHEDENTAHHVAESLDVIDEPATLESSQRMMNDGIAHVREAWNLFTAAGQAQVVNPICAFFNGVAQGCLAQKKQASEDEKASLQQTKKPLYDAVSYSPIRREDDADEVGSDKGNKM